MISKNDITTHQDIKVLIDSFYDLAMTDDLIGSFFTDVAKIKMEEHMPVMYQFWEAILFGSSEYRGDPMAKHILLSQKKTLEKHHFERWLHLFNSTVDGLFVGQNADKAKVRALSIATMMQIKLSQE